MMNLSITFTRPQMRINGQVFDVLRSDTAILQGLIELDADYADRDMSRPENILEKAGAMTQYIDTILGAGAAERIAGSIDGMEGFELGIAGTEALLAQISSAAMEAYARAIAAKYDD